MATKGLIFEFHWRRYSGDDALRKIFRLNFASDPSLENDKFVAAKSSHNIFDANDRTQTLGNRFKQEIAAVVPKGVIDPLEAIEIEEMYGNAITPQRKNGKCRSPNFG